jgi:hypothetical protein
MQQALRTQRVVWASILLTTVVLAAVLVAGIRSPEAERQDVLLPVLSALALVLSIMSFALPAYIHAQALARLQLPTTLEPDPTAEVPIHQKDPPLRKVVADPALARRRAAAVFQTPLILSLALSEAVGLFGFVLGFLGFELAEVAAFFVVSWGLIVTRFPTEERMVAPLERALGARVPRSNN